MFQYKHHTLLDITYGRCKAANSFELVVMSMKRLLTNNETEQLVVGFLPNRSQRGCQPDHQS
jgi:hypothetical protein